MEHFISNKLFTNRQFGFLKGRSTVTQLLQILDHTVSCFRNTLDTLWTPTLLLEYYIKTSTDSTIFSLHTLTAI